MTVFKMILRGAIGVQNDQPNTVPGGCRVWGMIEQTYYDVLGIMPEANFDDIRRAYLRLAKQYHPDLAENADDRRMAEINAAYEVLSNQSKKGESDIRFRPVKAHDFIKVQAKDTVERKTGHHLQLVF